MKSLFRFAFQKSFLIIVGTLCAILLLLWAILPLFGVERAEFVPTDFSVDAKGICYLGRKGNLHVFEDGTHVDTLTLPKELKGYDSFTVLPGQMLFEKDGTVWQAALDLSEVQACDDQAEALERLHAKKTIENRNYAISVKMFYGFVWKSLTKEVVAKTPLQDNIFRSTLIMLGLVVYVHGCRTAFYSFKIDRNNQQWRHPNWDD